MEDAEAFYHEILRRTPRSRAVETRSCSDCLSEEHAMRKAL
jgi:hypothetical protein